MLVVQWLENTTKKYSDSKISAVILGFSLVLVLIAFFVWSVHTNFAGLPKLRKISILTTTHPLSEMVSEIAGDDFKIVNLTPKGQDPRSITMESVSWSGNYKDNLVFGFGHGIDNWIEPLAQKHQAKLVLVDKDITTLLNPTLVTNPEASQAASLLEGEDPYYWVSPVNVLLIARNIKDILVNTYPQQKETIERNHNEYAKKIAKLDIDIRRQLQQQAPSFELVTIGATWKHLARDYNLFITSEWLAVPDDDSQIISKLSTNKPKVVFVDPFISSQKLKSLTEDSGVSFVVLDPFGGVEGRLTYEATIKYNLAQLLYWYQQER